ncbi:MAG: ChbG/HpnK family deacetylase [Acidobacteriota bacterium]|jgi:predicted glycoside hydrolase/deacetylase ChbG (UPF0249 family)
MKGRRAFLAAGAGLLAAEARKRLILIGDDIGAVAAIGDGTIEAYRNGIMRSANLIIPGPWLPQAIRLLQANPGLDTGVHLTLTSEWDRVKWRPLTPMSSLVDANGFLPPRTRDVAAPGVSLKEVEAELRAQIEMARRLLPRVSWLSSHMGAAVASDSLRELTLRLSREYRMPMQGDIAGLKRLKVPYSSSSTREEKVTAMLGMLEALTPGIHAMVDHPATDTAEMRQVGHEGNRNVAEQRAGILHAWCHPKVKEAVGRLGIELASVGACVKRPA